MSLYKVGANLDVSDMEMVDTIPRYDIVGAEQAPPQKGWGSILAIIGIGVFTFVVIPGKKGWQNALRGD